MEISSLEDMSCKRPLLRCPLAILLQEPWRWDQTLVRVLGKNAK
jgi:hypothetical protein